MAKWRGGARWREKLDEIERQLGTPEKLQVGFFSGAIEADGTPVPAVAAYNEFGVAAHGQPARPFFRTMIAEHKREWPKDMADIIKAAKFDIPVSLARLGDLVKGELHDSILKLWSPPLAPSTVRRKGFDKPLIETSTMLNSIDYHVVKP